MLSKEQKDLCQARHRQLVELLRAQRNNPGLSEYSEDVWEHTLGELTAGQYDGVVGLRMFLAELLARAERQEFLDKTAIRLCKIAGATTSESELRAYARVAYDQAEAMWRERQARRNRGDAEIPF